MIYNKLVIIILILVLFFCLKKKKNFEKFNNDKNSIMSDRKYLNYFNNLDLKLRKCSNLQSCIKKYNSSVILFNSNENEIINEIVYDINNILDGKFKKIFNEIKFIKVENYIENSLPHTRNRYIVLSDSLFDNIFHKYSVSKNFLKYNKNIRKLIYHEQFHIFQRYNPKLIEKLYIEYWNLEKMNIKLPKELLEINRTNPDALPDDNNHWLFKIEENIYILPLCVYNSSEVNDIKNTSNIYIIVKKNKGKFVIDDVKEQIKNKKYLVNQEKYRGFFGDETANNYHPNELSASIFEDIVENETNNYSTNYNFPGYLNMVNFLKDNELI